MTDRTEALRAAVLKVLPIDPDDGTTLVGFNDENIPTWSKPEYLADAIVDAVMAVWEQDGSVEWGARCTEPGHQHAGPMPFWFMQRERAEAYVNNTAYGGHELVTRRRLMTQWEAVSPDAPTTAPA